MTEHAASFPILSCMLLAPPLGLMILLLLKEEQKFLIRAVSLLARRHPPLPGDLYLRLL